MFWRFVHEVASRCSRLDWKNADEEQKYEFAVDVASQILTESSFDMLKLSLSIRMFSPAVQMGAEYTVACTAFFDVHGITGCSVEELENAVNSEQKRDVPELLPIDHIYGKETVPKTVAIVYADVGSPEWLQLHIKASELVSARKIQYVLRHYVKETDAHTLSLSGYGVELAIKNTEYKVVDDSFVKNDSDETDLHGFNFRLLRLGKVMFIKTVVCILLLLVFFLITRALYPDDSESFDGFRMHLKDIEELTPLKQWQVQDLSFQVSPIVVFMSIARETVSRELRDEIEGNQKDHLSGAGLDPGESMLFLNGINLDIDSLDMFQLVDVIKQEERVACGFFNMGFKREYLSILVGMDFPDDKTKYAIDYRDAYPMASFLKKKKSFRILFLNNLDTDRRYQHWRNSVKLLLEPYYPGMIRPIARNLFNLVFIVDPADRESRNLMKIAHSFFKHEIPLRIGFIFVVSNDENVTGVNDSGVAILNLFNFLAIDTSYHEALRIVNEMLDHYRVQDKIEPVDIKSWFESNYGDADYYDVFGPKSDYDNGRKVNFASHYFS
ncbi:hypothetical protein NECAME_16155 [Necator americanus]|uniref:UGGT thioredoxin-like domain-containing protein n=1 Tax=Necator americanus TaxID=51031 RepID=W2U0B6_NECAM|nr:hypothetical protein NECAME_16155 [Necator americanus]ETN86742.1 hypothetical protein NECAME_16155 [Necator americanus]